MVNSAAIIDAESDDQILIAAVSDEALEAAAGASAGTAATCGYTVETVPMASCCG